MSALHVIDPHEYRRTRWKNDGGWTTELASSPPPDHRLASDPFRWRVSIAEIQSDGPFSTFPGVDRDLFLLDGKGIELDIGDADPVRLVQRYQRVHFAGEVAVHCRLLAGSTRDFNVMTWRDSVRAEVVARPLLGTMVVFPAPDTEWFMHVLSGSVLARSGGQRIALYAGFSLRVNFNEVEAVDRVLLEGTGEVLLVKFIAITA